MESEIVNVASLYSKYWKKVKIKPKRIVAPKPIIVSALSPLTIDRWAQVKETPEVNRISVFKSGTDQGSKAIIPIDGKTQPISIFGLKLA
jgi:hypothetical protein